MVAAMRGARDELARRQGSSVRKVKNVMAFAGAMVGLGATVASFAVDDQDTKASVAQIGAGVAGISTVIALLPIGKESPGDRQRLVYLETELAQFEARWPTDLGRELTAEEWRLFRQDSRRLARTLEALGP
jgi:hypothetical protein